MGERIQVAAVRVLRAEGRGDVHAHRVRRRGELPVIGERRHLVVESPKPRPYRCLAVAEDVPCKTQPRVEQPVSGVYAGSWDTWVARHQVALGQRWEPPRLDACLVAGLAEL